MESKFYKEDKLLVFKITEDIDDHSVQKIRRRADYGFQKRIRAACTLHAAAAPHLRDHAPPRVPAGRNHA